MDIIELMEARHSVRRYKSKAIEPQKREQLDRLIAEINAESGLCMQVLYDEPHCFDSFMAHYGKFANVSNYIAVIGTKQDNERAGYYGEKAVLECQRLGLNTCWVAMTHGKTEAKLEKGQRLLIVIALGYGETQGIPHKSKPVSELCRADEAADWFERGMRAVCLAPTALNQQKFFFELKNGNVGAKAGRGFYTDIDLGIAKYHFEAATGRHVM